MNDCMSLTTSKFQVLTTLRQTLGSPTRPSSLHNLNRPATRLSSRSVTYSLQKRDFHRDSTSRRVPLSSRPGGKRALDLPSSLQASYGQGFYISKYGPRETRAMYATETSAQPEPVIHDLFETKTGTWQYVVADPSTSTAVIIDPVLDFDQDGRVITSDSADKLLSVIRESGYKVEKILETHAHADHLTAASYLQSRITQEQGHKPSMGIGKLIPQVQNTFGERYGILKGEYENVFDEFFEEGDTFNIGNLKVTAIHLPGHTPDHMGYIIGGNVFCGDSLFHPDLGSARCDFPGGSATKLYNSVQKLLSLPDHMKIWSGHDYPPAGRNSPVAWTTVKDQKSQNKHLKNGVTQEQFVAMREERDATLGEPRLLHQSLQVNIQAGRLPKPTESGQRLLHLPFQVKAAEW